MSAYFITSCGTGIGKTFITTTLCWHLSESDRIVHAIKPVVTGWNNSDILSSDTGRILCSLSMDCNSNNVTKVSPWRFCYPHAPNIAARLENVELNYSEILMFCCQYMEKPHNYLFIEGIGGIMSPITDNKTCLDLIRDLNVKVVLVIGSYLGSISHALTGLEVLRNMNVRVVLSVNHENATNIDDIVKFICKYTGKLVYVQPYVKGSFNLWKDTSNDIIDFIVG
ncbi:dethiobiotin synthase [Ehrlichia sp. JZT12]